MNKDDVYKIIGYHGEYTNNVKKAIRKLLKENHPDNKGNRDIFELINEVKIELENNTVPNKYQKRPKADYKINDDIDYDFCYSQIDLLNKRCIEYKKTLGEYKDELAKVEEEYCKIYRQSVDLELSLLSSSKEVKKIQNIKYTSIWLLLIILLVFVDMTKNSKKRFKEYVIVNNNIRENINKQEELKNKILYISKKINSVENDLRFYNNLLK